MAFAVGAFYQNWESAILRIISSRKGYIASNFACFLLFAVLIACSALFGNIISTVLAYSLLPLWVVAVLVPLDCSKAAKNRIVLFGGAVSYEVYLVHGIVMDYLNRHTSLDGMAFAAVTLITSFIAAVLLKYMVSFVSRSAERALSLLTGSSAKTHDIFVMDKILSIIIPSYNMEAYLAKGLDSVLSIDNPSPLDVIVVNDGSKDGTLEIARSYATRFPGIVNVIDKENGHYGSCINAGLKIAQGKYVRILDADDSFYTDEFEEFVKFLKTTDADLIVNDYKRNT